jgi:hypothetical protein
MNGREIEHLLSGIDENILLGRTSLRQEIFSYLLTHEAEVLTALRMSDKVTVPTSSGPIEINLSALVALVA